LQTQQRRIVLRHPQLLHGQLAAENIDADVA
jgi:hypothetical protein